MSTTRHSALEIPVRTVGVELVRGTVVTRPEGPLEKLTIGTAEGADWVLADASVSRFHVELSASGAGVLVRDLGSTNGVVSGTSYLDDAVVPPGTLLELGDACVRVTRGGGRAPALGASRLGPLITESASMRRLAHRIGALADQALPLSIEGPLGSGKELVARTLHDLSSRASSPFVVVDCGTLSDTLGTSELFGHEKGAFTDAGESRAGAFERAGAGTLVLDEIGRLSPALQPALLGVLERRQFRRMGGSATLPVSARVIAISSLDLRREVNAGRLRLDLFYRLAGVRLDVPALKDRLDDLGPLVVAFLRELGHGDSHPLASEASIEALATRPWPQNVRELRAWVAERATLGDVVTEDPSVEAASDETLEAMFTRLAAAPYKEARAEVERRFEEAYLTHVAALARGSVSAAARLAGLDRSQLRTLARRAGVTLKK